MGIVSAYVVPHPPLIIPEVGRGSQQGIQKTIDSYREVARRIVALAPDTIVIASPHAPLYRNAFYLDAPVHLWGDMRAFRAPEASLEVAGDSVLASTLSRLADESGIPLLYDKHSSGEMDHGTFIPLYFVRELLDKVKVVRIGLSGLSAAVHKRLGALVAQASDECGERVVFIASGDMSHKLKADGPYGFDARGPQFDNQVVKLFEAGDLDGLFTLDASVCYGAAECGLGAFQMMAGALEQVCAAQHATIASEALSYEGPFGVGYAVAAFELAKNPAGETEADPYVELARLSVEHFVKTGRSVPLPDGLPSELLERRAGAFVSLHKHGQLRGCIGTISAVQDCLANEIIANGIAACSRDPRFAPVRDFELDSLSYSVDVLGDPEDIAGEEVLDPKRFGVIVTKGYKRGLLLPDLEGVDTVEVQVAIAKQKAGIAVSDRDVRLQRFEVVRHDRGGQARVP